VQTVVRAGTDRHRGTDDGGAVTDGNDVVSSGYSRSDHQAAAELALRAGELLAELQQGDLQGKELGAQGDRRSHELLTALLAERFPNDRVRSEEDDQREALTTDVGRV
jgi:fructose-1,6-bisphosphatase/inositol monophosphatase family enzyme